MSKISVVMPVYNGEKYLFEAIDSVLNQSFKDFEFIIIDDGSTDDTLSIINSFCDKRIILVKNNHDFIKSLNFGLKKASGKYIARMDADDIMHIDRLNIQYAIMEEEPEITVCGTWSQFFGENGNYGILKTFSGIVEDPVIHLIRNNFITHPSVMIRKSFLKTHCLQYENYNSAEDYKFWFEIAKLGGVFFIESQPLLYYRVSKEQVTNKKEQEMVKSSYKIKTEIIKYLIDRNLLEKTRLRQTYNHLKYLESKGFISQRKMSNFFYEIFYSNKNLNY